MSQHHKTTRADRAAYAEYVIDCKAADAPCWLCAQDIDYEAALDDYSNDDRFQRDHYYPASTHPELYYDRANWRPSHAGCNRERGNGAPMPALGSLSRAW